MAVKDVRDGLVTRLKTISGLEVRTRVPDNVTPPMAVVMFKGMPFTTTFDQTNDPRFTIKVLTSKVSDQGEDDLYDYLDGGGAESIKAAVEGDPTLGGVVDYAEVTEVNDMAVTTAPDGVQYYTVDFTVEVGS